MIPWFDSVRTVVSVPACWFLTEIFYFVRENKFVAGVGEVDAAFWCKQICTL